ncbi:MAG: hypothetical protein ACI8RD_011236 [Bacillariaceae sp.]|jgi:hypothetical protein
MIHNGGHECAPLMNRIKQNDVILFCIIFSLFPMTGSHVISELCVCLSGWVCLAFVDPNKMEHYIRGCIILGDRLFCSYLT